MSKFTCKGCAERHIGCHSTCAKYLAECEQNEREKAALAKATGNERDIKDYRIASRNRMREKWRTPQRKSGIGG